MPLSLKTFWYDKVPGSQTVRLVKVTPYLRIARDGHPPVYVQGGKVYSEGGPEMKPVPAWLDEEMAKITPKVREEVGWKGTAAVKAAEPEPAPPPPTTWTCPECQEAVAMKRKGVHIAGHRKADRLAKGG